MDLKKQNRGRQGKTKQKSVDEVKKNNSYLELLRRLLKSKKSQNFQL